MLALKALVLCALATLASAPVANPAPYLTVSPTQLQAGGVANITYHNPALAGAEVTIDIDDGSLPSPKTQKITVILDQNGTAQIAWPVPNWEFAKFNADNVPEVGRIILP